MVGFILAVWFVNRVVGGEDAPIKYENPSPKVPDEERILDEPSIKVRQTPRLSSSRAPAPPRPSHPQTPRPNDPPQIPGSSAIQCYAPATGQLLGLINPSTPSGLDRAIAQASAAQQTWAHTTFRQRRAVLRSMLRHVLDNQHELARIACLDSGKTMVDAQLGEILVTAERLKWTLEHGEAALSPDRRPTNLLMKYKRNEIWYEPLGVVAALVSWNYPFHNLIGPVISALFAGNAIVVKASEQTAWSASFFANVARGALAAHGHDPSLVQPVVCWPSVAPHLTSHPSIAHVTFIGSRPVCQKVAASAAQSLTPLVAELGGKDAAVILDSARKDLPRIVDILMRGTFQSAGQNCIGIERVIVAPSLYDGVVSALEPKVKALRLGPKADVGALVSPASFSSLEALVDDAVKSGARLLAGGKRHVHPEHPSGHYFAPTLLADVTPEMAIAQEEVFGPILTLMRAPAPSPTPADTASSLLELANNSFGLGASVFGSESDPVLQLVARGLKTGNLSINDFAAYYAVQLPFGGTGGSGYGKFAGAEGLRGLCNAKSVCADRAQWMGIRTAIPPPVQYPVADQERSWRFASGVVGLGYGLGIGDKVKSVVDILRNM